MKFVDNVLVGGQGDSDGESQHINVYCAQDREGQRRLRLWFSKTIPCCEVLVGDMGQLSVWRKSIHFAGISNYFVTRDCAKVGKPWIGTYTVKCKIGTEFCQFFYRNRALTCELQFVLTWVLPNFLWFCLRNFLDPLGLKKNCEKVTKTERSSARFFLEIEEISAILLLRNNHILCIHFLQMRAA